jgi:hypothetical protein
MLVGTDRFRAVASTPFLARDAGIAFKATEECDVRDHKDDAIRADLQDLCLQMLAFETQARPSVSAILCSGFLLESAAELTNRNPDLRRILNQDQAPSAAVVVARQAVEVKADSAEDSRICGIACETTTETTAFITPATLGRPG